MPVAHTRTGYKAYAYTAVSIGAQAMTSARVYNGLEMSGGSLQAVPRSKRQSTSFRGGEPGRPSQHALLGGPSKHCTCRDQHGLMHCGI